jgi:2-C-methyl-D-erythritol 4-phosphate cytidylyltransferase
LSISNSVQNERFFAVIPCAGIGTRAGAGLPKQYRPVADHPLLYYALTAFDACHEFSQTVVVLAHDDRHFNAQQFKNLRFAARRCGGASRQTSVLNGLNALTEFGAQAHDWALVHDAARPGVTPALIRALINAVRTDPVGGILALPLADTLKCAVPATDLPAHFSAGLPSAQARRQYEQYGKREATPGKPVKTEGFDKNVLESTRIMHTEQQTGRWLAQTPQMFRLGMLREALLDAQHNQCSLTDEASALERLGYSPQLIVGSTGNFKVTYPDDFELADALLSQRKQQEQ